jgi:glycosyltransferase involved in cell wall biosynthesis
MRILHVTSTFLPDSQGGIEELVRQICINTISYGVESRVFTLSRDPMPEVILIDGIEVFRVKKSFEISSCGFSITAFNKFKELIDWADVVHYHYPWPYQDLLNITYGHKAKSILTYHSDIVRQRKLKVIYNPIMKFFLGRVNKIIATSENYVESSQVLKSYQDKINVIPIGLNKSSYPKISNDDLINMQSKVGENFILFIGKFRQYKGLNYLLDALSNSSFNCVIVGNGFLEKQLTEKAKKLGLSNVIFLGAVSEVDKVALIKLCRALILPSNQRSEAFGICLLEGAMYAKPLISTELGTGSSFVNIDNNTGFVVPPSDSEALKNAMLKLINNESLAKKMGDAAQARFEELFTGERMGQNYFQVYKELIGKNN